MKSKHYELVLSYYMRGLWSAARVLAAVGKWIEAEEAAEILAMKPEN